MALRKILYPLDFTGAAPSNRIEGELHTIGADRYRAFTLNLAPFYATTLTVKERGKTALLKRGTDYELLYFYSELAKLAGGKEICGVIVVHNDAVGTDLEIGYNTVGGHYASSTALIAAAIADLDLDNRNVYWQNIIDTPELFQPAPHLHDIGDVYGLEFIIDVLTAIREAIMIGNSEMQQQLLDRVDAMIAQFTLALNTHLADVSNPHDTTAHQVGTYTKEEIDQLVLSLLQDLADLEPRFQAIATTFVSITNQFTAVNGTLKSLSDRIGLVELEQSKFGILLGVINATLADLQGQIDVINGEITDLKLVDVSLQKQIDNTNKRIDTIVTSIDGTGGIKDRLDDLETDVSANTDSINTLTEDLATVNDGLSDYVLWSATARDQWIYSTLVGKVAYIAPTGNMEIGSQITMHHAAAPDPALSLYISPSATTSMSTLVNSGYFNCQDIYIRSDIRDKHEITEVSPLFADAVLREIGHGIRYKLQAETEFTVGVSAQDVLRVFPEAIREQEIEDAESRLILRQSAMIGLLVSGYNRQAEQIDELLARLAPVKDA